MYIIKTKNEGYTGEISGIPFLNGIAKVENLSATDVEWFKSYGHTVEETEKVEENTVEETNSEEAGKNKKGR
ncbi:hypothetical protein YWH7199_08340 [Fusobacterium nucleatum YWH7199]|uniref:hypothetical protein n=1 Tax=Fusobacterium nucleatum TaxID=851 RepID=UPI00201AC63F|nr:hypothetical protein [Fusobacterium nucleatum]MCL4581405.1 hypothetical protein [Fusobacterium nucleatum YWH7199]